MILLRLSVFGLLAFSYSLNAMQKPTLQEMAIKVISALNKHQPEDPLIQSTIEKLSVFLSDHTAPELNRCPFQQVYRLMISDNLSALAALQFDSNDYQTENARLTQLHKLITGKPTQEQLIPTSNDTAAFKKKALYCIYGLKLCSLTITTVKACSAQKHQKKITRALRHLQED